MTIRARVASDALASEAFEADIGRAPEPGELEDRVDRVATAFTEGRRMLLQQMVEAGGPRLRGRRPRCPSWRPGPAWPRPGRRRGRPDRSAGCGRSFRDHQGPDRLDGAVADTAALLLITAGDRPERLRSEAAWAHLCGAAPIAAGSGKTDGRVRFNPGGDRQANHALWRIVLTRMRSDARTRDYVQRRTADGLSKPEIICCLKRYVAREVFHQLRPAAD